MTARPGFRQTDLTRAIKGARAAGMVITQAEIMPDGRIILTEAQQQQDDPYGTWKSRRESRAERSASG